MIKTVQIPWIMCKKNNLLLLSHDEGDVDTVGRIIRRCPLSSSGIKHGQCGQRLWRTTTVACHVPQLIAVPVDGVVMVKLEPEHNRWREERNRKNKEQEKRNQC